MLQLLWLFAVDTTRRRIRSPTLLAIQNIWIRHTGFLFGKEKAPDPLVERLYERTAQFDGVGQEFVAEFVAEAEVVFGGHVLRMRRARDDEAVPADDLLRFGITDEQLLVALFRRVLCVDVDRCAAYG